MRARKKASSRLTWTSRAGSTGRQSRQLNVVKINISSLGLVFGIFSRAASIAQWLSGGGSSGIVCGIAQSPGFWLAKGAKDWSYEIHE